MPFAWSNIKVPVQQPPLQQPTQEDIQIVILPAYDKISDIEHKNGKFMDGTRKKDDEVGIGKKEGNG